VNAHRVILTKDSEKYFLKLSQSLPATGRKISKWIDALKTNPHLGKKLQGSDRETRRIKVGDYRIIYEVYEDQKLIVVVYIGTRGGAY
jgi:mRNA interferase RelE/StbE